MFGKCRASRPEMFCEKGESSKIHTKTLAMESFSIKSVGLDLYGVLSCEFYEMLLNSYSVEHARTTASVNFCRLSLFVTLFKDISIFTCKL